MRLGTYWNEKRQSFSTSSFGSSQYVVSLQSQVNAVFLDFCERGVIVVFQPSQGLC